MKMKILYITLVLMLYFFNGCAPLVRFSAEKARESSPGKSDISTSASGTVINKEESDEQEPLEIFTGKASYYANKFHGKKTASGELYDKTEFTAAHRSLPFGSLIRITNTVNNKSVVCRVNDRGPFVSGRVVDVSRAAAEEIDMIRQGIADVEVEVISVPE